MSVAETAQRCGEAHFVVYGESNCFEASFESAFLFQTHRMLSTCTMAQGGPLESAFCEVLGEDDQAGPEYVDGLYSVGDNRAALVHSRWRVTGNL